MSGSVDYTQLFSSPYSTAADGLLNVMYGGAPGSALGAANPLLALRTAQLNQTKDIAVTAKLPQVARDVAAFKTAVAAAKTPAALLKNPIVMKVLLTANGMADQIDYTALTQRALLSNTKTTGSLVSQLNTSDARWKPFVQTYDFANKGLSILQKPTTLATLASAYAEVTWRQSLDATTPGLSSALTFRAQAATVKSVDQILGDPVLRDVVTTALNIPREIAFQSITAQEKAISTRLDLTKLKNSHFVDTLTQEYLLNKASSGTTNTSQSSLEQLSARAYGLVV